MADLSSVTAQPFSFAKRERVKPMRGRLKDSSGYLRWPLNEYRFVSPRNLQFRLERSGDEVTFVGEFVVWTGYRLIICAWLWTGLLWNLEQAVVPPLFYHAVASRIGLDVAFFLIGPVMAYGYVWICIGVGRGREKALVRVLSTVAQGSVATGIVRSLLVE